MNILGIESSCDETAVAVVKEGRTILSNVVASQVELHARYGGIVPEVASRQHLLAFLPTLQRALAEAKVLWGDLAAVAVTVGPGLAGSLLVGVNLAKALALAHDLPLVGVNHLEGHLYANWLGPSQEGLRPDPPPTFPLACLIVSGGHTDLVLMQGHGRYQLLGRTRDDAAGEAFDKVARILGLGYPGGPAIEQACRGVPATYRLPRPWLKGSHDFSFSGLKTAVLHLARNEGIYPPQPDPSPELRRHTLELAASFQETVVDVLVTKTVEAALEHRASQVLLAGGVAANTLLRESLLHRSPLPCRIPRPALCTDNAAMIAACAYFRLCSTVTDWALQEKDWTIEVAPNLKLGSA